MGAYILVLALQKGLFLLSVLYVLPISISHVRSSPIGLLARKFWHLTGTITHYLLILLSQWDALNLICADSSVPLREESGEGVKKEVYLVTLQNKHFLWNTVRVAVDLSSWTELSSSASFLKELKGRERERPMKWSVTSDFLLPVSNDDFMTFTISCFVLPNLCLPHPSMVQHYANASVY